MSMYTISPDVCAEIDAVLYADLPSSRLAAEAIAALSVAKGVEGAVERASGKADVAVQAAIRASAAVALSVAASLYASASLDTARAAVADARAAAGAANAGVAASHEVYLAFLEADSLSYAAYVAVEVAYKDLCSAIGGSDISES